jgi:hypothetical protein
MVSLFSIGSMPRQTDLPIIRQNSLALCTPSIANGGVASALAFASFVEAAAADSSEVSIIKQ